jgi:hypothetical protein
MIGTIENTIPSSRKQKRHTKTIFICSLPIPADSMQASRRAHGVVGLVEEEEEEEEGRKALPSSASRMDMVGRGRGGGEGGEGRGKEERSGGERGPTTEEPWTTNF